MIYKGIRIIKEDNSGFSTKHVSELEDVILPVRFLLSDINCWGGVPCRDSFKEEREIIRVYFKQGGDFVDIIEKMFEFDILVEKYQRTLGINFKLQ